MPKTSTSLVRILSSLFFLSGFAALIYEVIWFKRFTHVWGSSSLSQMAVVTTFLFGLALGAWIFGRFADRVKSPLEWYCVFELAIGVLALLVPYEIILLRWFSSIIYPVFQDHSYLQFTVRFVLTFLVIGPACTLMGGTLPLLMKHFLTVHPWSRETTGWLYSVNTLGAAFGAFFAGFYLLPGLGMIGSNWLAVAIDFYVAMLVYILLHQYKEETQPESSAVDETPFPSAAPEWAHFFSARSLYLACALTGCASLILQMVWTRNLALILGGTTYAFSSMLFVFLLGIGLGSLVYSRTVRKITNLAWTLSAVISVLVLFIAMGKISLPHLASAVGFMRGLRSDSILNGLISFGVNAVLQLIPTLCMGFLFPFFVDILRWRTRDVGTVVGNVYTWNTAGSILGTVITPAILLTALGTPGTLTVTILLYGISFLLVFPYSYKKSLAALFPAILIAGTMLLITSRPIDPRLTNLGQYLYGYRPISDIQTMFQTVYYKESTCSNVIVLDTQVNRHLRVNGKADAGDNQDMPMQMGLAYYPRLFHPEARDVLVIGYGSGTTAGCSVMFPKTRVTCCEIEPAVVEAGVFFSHVNHQPELSRNFEMILDDGRSYLEGCQKKFDLILSEPSNPWMAGISNLFTREFYQEVQKHLQPQGVFTQWIQTYDSTNTGYSMILRTIMDVFPHCALVRISISDTLLLASDRPLLPTAANMDAAQKLLDDSPVVAQDLDAIFATKDAAHLMLRGYMLPEENLRKFAESYSDEYLNTDQNLRLEFSAPLQLYIPKEWQQAVDSTLVGCSDPAWLTGLYQKWNCNAQQIAALKLWIRIYQHYGYNDKTPALTEFALQYAPDDPFLLAQHLADSTSDTAKFDAILERLISVSMEEAFKIGVELQKKQQHVPASKIFSKIVERHPTRATAWTHLALSYAELKMWQQAGENFARALEQDPHNPYLQSSYEAYQQIPKEKETGPDQ